MFIYLNSVRSLNVCNAVKTVSSAHHIRRVFPITHYVISNHTRMPSFRNKSSPLYLTSNPRFSPLVTSPWNLQHISLSAKFCIFFMMFFNVTLLNQPIQNILVFDILTDLILLLLVYLRFSIYLFKIYDLF